MTAMDSTQSANPGRLRRLFFGPAGIRAGWRFLIFVAIILALRQGKALLVAKVLNGLDQDSLSVINLLLAIGILFLATGIMGKFEGRKFADYGLPWRQTLGRQFWLGTLFGFTTITALLFAMRMVGVFSFGERALYGGAIWTFAGLYGLFYVVGALWEEFLCRGYALFTLSTGIGFWPSAILSSACFGSLHYFNPGETAFGAFSAGLFGLLFCLLLRRTGNLWMPIGFHAAYNWGECFLYGAPDSGSRAPEHFLNSSFSGPVWLTGGSVGPEGSLLCILLVVGLCLICAACFREIKYPGPSAITGAGRVPATASNTDPAVSASSHSKRTEGMT